jgi:hypothetical protein
MSHDKIRAAARKRMTETGEPYAAARRVVVTGHRAAGEQIPSPDAGCALRMSGEIHDWLAGLRGSDPAAAMLVAQALAALMTEGAGLGAPLVISTADSWPWALGDALDRSYQESLERLTLLRRGEAEAITLVGDIQDQVAELEWAQAKLEDSHRRAREADRPREAAQAAGKLAMAQQQAAEARRLLPEMIRARDRLGEVIQRRQARADAFRTRKEILKASYVAAQGNIKVREAIAASGLTDDDGDGPHGDGDEELGAAQARLADVIAQMERELGQPAWPEGLMELRPGAPEDTDTDTDKDTGICIMFAVEPPGVVLLIAVLEGSEAIQDHYPEAILLSADMLRRVRAGQAPEAATHGYPDAQSFLEEFHPCDTEPMS